MYSNNEIIICIGSNEPDAGERVSTALEFLSGQLPGMVSYGPYKTAPAPPADPSGPAYANAVGKATTSLTLVQIKERLKQWEQSLGRRPEHKTTGRVVIDMDVVMYGDEICRRSEFNAEYFQKGYRELCKELTDNQSNFGGRPIR